MAGLADQIKERLSKVSEAGGGIMPKTGSLLSLPSDAFPNDIQKGETLELKVQATVKSIGKRSVAVSIDSADVLSKTGGRESNLSSEILSSLPQSQPPQGGNV